MSRVETVARIIGQREMMTRDEWVADGRRIWLELGPYRDDPSGEITAEDDARIIEHADRNYAAYEPHRAQHRDMAQRVLDALDRGSDPSA